MSWRLAGSLVKLRDQINAAHPHRSKVSDGTIGDSAHAATVSDHNPNAQGVVCALDITHDPENGVDIDKLSDVLAASRDPRIKYLIANSLILVPEDSGWTWQGYQGSNPHTSHLHVSVYGDYDNQKEWDIGAKKVIENREDVNKLYRATLHRDVESEEVARLRYGMDWETALNDICRSEEYLTQNHILLIAYPAIAKEIESLKAKLASTDVEQITKNLKAALDAISKK